MLSKIARLDEHDGTCDFHSSPTRKGFHVECRFRARKADRPTLVRGARLPQLTRREREVLELIAQGESNPAIARRFTLSQKTVRNHVSNIFTKLQVADRSQAIVKAREAGMGAG
jgi:DNA-binding NarL/FixJ family response regulator